MADDMTGTWQLSARAPDGSRVGVVEVYDKFEAVQRHLGVGAWALDMSLDDPMALELLVPGAGIIAELDDVPMFSGVVEPAGITVSGASRTLSLSGPDDLVVLASRVAHQEPANAAAPPWSTTEALVRTGVGETVIKAYVNENAGPGAIALRRWPGLTIAPDLARGSTVTGRARLDNLLEHCVELAVLAGLGLRCVDLVFDVTSPADLTGLVEFSDARESIAGYSYAREAPAATTAYVGGGGLGVARTFVATTNDQAIAEGWQRREVFVDRRDTTDPTELQQAGTVALIGQGASGTDRTGVDIVPIDTPGCAWPTDYAVGDLVAWVDPFEVTRARLVQAVTLTLTSSTVTAVPTLGTIIPDIPAQFAALRNLVRRTSRLETR